jgi:hypothetical protein
LLDETGKPLFKTVDIWRSQFNILGDNSKEQNRGKNEYFPFQFPAVFVEPQVHWIDTSDRGTQRQHCTIVLHIGVWRLDLEKGDNWKIPFKLRTEAHKAIQRLKPDDTYTSLVKSIEYQDNFYENFYIWKMEYTTMIVDSTAFQGQYLVSWDFNKYNIEKK